jgi:HPt (histidine-containing phosphotransfer) domain-containing protein
MQEDKTVFDKDVALKMFEGEEEFLEELAEIFINDAPEHMSEIEEAVNCRNSEALEKSAHKLKGAVANFGKNVTTDTAFKLETMGRENNLDGVEEVSGTLVKDIENLVNALKEFVKLE